MEEKINSSTNKNKKENTIIGVPPWLMEKTDNFVI